MTDLVLLLAIGIGLPVSVIAVRAMGAARWRQELEAYELHFPRGLQPAAVMAFLSGLTGIVAPRVLRPFAARAVVVEVTGTKSDGIRHHLLIPRSMSGVVLGQLRAAMPSVRVERDKSHAASQTDLSGELRLAGEQRQLRVEPTENVVAAILATLQPLEDDERVVVQWVLAPVGPVAPVPTPSSKRPKAGPELLLEGVTTTLRDAESVRAARVKRAAPLYAAACRLGVSAAPARARMLLRGMGAGFHSTTAPGVHLKRRAVSNGQTSRALLRRSLPLVRYPCQLNATELTALLAFPVGDIQVPGLSLGGCRQLAPASSIPHVGRVVAVATFPGAQRPLALSTDDSLRHLHVIGPTGVGKSTLLLNLISQDIQAGAGVFVIDPKGDLVADVLDRVPRDRVDDVIVLDPTDESRPVGFNLLAGATSAPELVTDQVVSIFHQLYRAFWGPRTDDVLRASLLTLAHEPGMTLVEVPLLLTDPGFRRQLVGRLDDPIGVGSFWAWYEGISDAERSAAIGPVLNKLRAFLMRKRIRNVVGQADSAFDMAEAAAGARIVLVPLSKGLLGEEASALLGSLVVARLWQAIQGRSGIPPSKRRPLFAYIDEVQDYLHLPTSIGDVLAQARGLGMSLTLAHQHLGQLPTELRRGVLANARSRVIFQPSSDDARVLARELTPYLEPSDLQGLGPHEVVVHLMAGAAVAPPATGRTMPPPEPTGQADEARERSRQRYGRDRADVEAAIRARHERRPGPGPVGRREVKS